MDSRVLANAACRIFSRPDDSPICDATMSRIPIISSTVRLRAGGVATLTLSRMRSSARDKAIFMADSKSHKVPSASKDMTLIVPTESGG